MSEKSTTATIIHRKVRKAEILEFMIENHFHCYKREGLHIRTIELAMLLIGKYYNDLELRAFPSREVLMEHMGVKSTQLTSIINSLKMVADDDGKLLWLVEQKKFYKSSVTPTNLYTPQFVPEVLAERLRRQSKSKKTLPTIKSVANESNNIRSGYSPVFKTAPIGSEEPIF